MSTNEILEEFGHLCLDEKLGLLEALWGRVAPSDADAVLTDQQRRALKQRLSEVAGDDRPARSLEDVYGELRDKRRR